MVNWPLVLEAQMLLLTLMKAVPVEWGKNKIAVNWKMSGKKKTRKVGIVCLVEKRNEGVARGGYRTGQVAVC